MCVYMCVSMCVCMCVCVCVCVCMCFMCVCVYACSICTVCVYLCECVCCVCACMCVRVMLQHTIHSGSALSVAQVFTEIHHLSGTLRFHLKCKVHLQIKCIIIINTPASCTHTLHHNRRTHTDTDQSPLPF